MNLWQPARIPTFVSYANLAAQIAASDQIGRLVNRSTGARIGDFRHDGTTLMPIGKVDLTAVSTSRYGVIASVESTTSITLTAGHTLVTGDSVHIVDVSAGAELTSTYRTVTVTGNVVTWTGAVASMAAGDLVFARGVSEIELDHSATGFAQSTGGTVVWNSGLVCASTGCMGWPIGACANTLAADTTNIDAKITATVANSGDIAAIGFCTTANKATLNAAGFGHNGTSIRVVRVTNTTPTYGGSYTSGTPGRARISAENGASSGSTRWNGISDIVAAGTAGSPVTNATFTSCSLRFYVAQITATFTSVARA